MYLIQSGRVRIAVHDADGKEIVLAELAQGDFFGEMAIIDGKQRSADAAVIEDAHLSVLSRENFLRFINSNPGVALEMLSAVFQRLRHTDKMLQQRVSRNVNEEQDKRMTIADRAPYEGVIAGSFGDGACLNTSSDRRIDYFASFHRCHSAAAGAGPAAVTA